MTGGGELGSSYPQAQHQAPQAFSDLSGICPAVPNTSSVSCDLISTVLVTEIRTEADQTGFYHPLGSHAGKMLPVKLKREDQVLFLTSSCYTSKNYLQKDFQLGRGEIFPHESYNKYFNYREQN